MNDSGRSGDQKRLGIPHEVEAVSIRENAPVSENNGSGVWLDKGDTFANTPTKSIKQNKSASLEAKPVKTSAMSNMKSDTIDSTSMADPAPKTNELPLSAGIQSRIGAQMQSFYNDLLKEKTPDRFLKLLEELDQKSPPR